MDAMRRAAHPPGSSVPVQPGAVSIAGAGQELLETAVNHTDCGTDYSHGGVLVGAGAGLR